MTNIEGRIALVIELISLNSFTEDDSEKSREKHSCRANVHIEAAIPEEFADALRQLPFLGINAKGR